MNTTSRVSYAHVSAKANGRHLASLLHFFESVCKPKRHDGGLSIVDIMLPKDDLQAHVMDAKPLGKSMDKWRNALGLEDTHTDIPGDPVHPDVFQR